MGVFSILQSNRKFYHIYTSTIVIHKSHNLLVLNKLLSLGLNRARFFIVILSLYRPLSYPDENQNRRKFCYILQNFRICTIVIEALTPLDRTSYIKMYKNNARSRLICRIAKRSIDRSAIIKSKSTGKQETHRHKSNQGIGYSV